MHRASTGQAVKLRLFPQENAGLELLSRMGTQLIRGAGTLSEVLGAEPGEYERLAEELHQGVCAGVY